jgi:hypothetical protein
MTRAVQDTLPPSPSNDRALETLGQASGLAACKPRAALSNPIVAKLFAHYIDVLAPWYDLNESLLPFGATVPAHALECPILFKALIAFSATHKYKTLRQFAELATAFHAACVRELLDSIEHEKPESQGDYLAATCLLRSYEILNGTGPQLSRQRKTDKPYVADSRKEQRHLLGAYSFVASGSINLVGRGLLQAGAWNYLREEITVALECCRSVRISRDFEYQAYENMPDDMQANHVSYLLARIINLSFGDQVKRIPLENRMVEWHSLDAALNVWKDRLPATFEPYSTAQIAGNVFPSLWMLRPWHGNIRLENLDDEVANPLCSCRLTISFCSRNPVGYVSTSFVGEK